VRADNWTFALVFPSTTAAFRLNPRSFARFIGEHLNAAENSSCVIARSR